MHHLIVTSKTNLYHYRQVSHKKKISLKSFPCQYVSMQTPNECHHRLFKDVCQNEKSPPITRNGMKAALISLSSKTLDVLLSRKTNILYRKTFSF